MLCIIRSSWPFILLGGSFAVIATLALASSLRQIFGFFDLVPNQILVSTIGPVVVVGTFGPVAVLLLSFAGMYSISCRTERKLQKQFPGRKWLHRKDWQANLSRHFLTQRAFAYSAIAISANSLTIGGFSLLLFENLKQAALREQIGLIIIAAGFVSLTSLGGIYVLWLIRDAILLRSVTCQLIAPPFLPGDAVRAFVAFDRFTMPRETMTVTLECTSDHRTRERFLGMEVGEAETFHRIHYQACFLIDASTSLDACNHDLPIRFCLPDTVPDTDAFSSATWNLSLRWCSTTKRTHSLEFELPVFRVEQQANSDVSERFDQRFYKTNLPGFPRFARPVSLRESIESFGGKFYHHSTSDWEVCLPRENNPGTFQRVISGCGLFIFLGGGLLIGGLAGLCFAILPWICLSATMRRQRLCVDGPQIRYHQGSYWRRKLVTVDISEIEGVGYQQKERTSAGVGIYQVTATLTSGHCIELLSNAHSRLIAAGITKRLNTAIHSIGSDERKS